MLDILARWNRWGSGVLCSGIEREITAKLQPFLNSPEIVALIGPRRAGKTTVLFQVMDILEKLGIPQQAMLHVNLEEPALSAGRDLELLDEIYHTYRTEIYPQGKAYLFLDEIQNVPRWERWVRARNETEDIKFFITGSSSQLMSKELGTLLTGRHVSFKVMPLSFKEFLHFKSITPPKRHAAISPPAIIEYALKEFLRWGGFPEVVLAENDQRKELLLKQYFDDVLFKDVAMRYRIRDLLMLRDLAVFLLTQTGSLVSLQRIAKIFEVSMDSARSYCQYLQEAFLVDFLPFYSRKIAERQRHPKKVYAVDLGLRQVVSLANSADEGHAIETAVYHALQRQSNDGIFYWQKQQEVDFLVRQKTICKILVQVVWKGLEKTDIQTRELLSLQKAKKLFVDAELLIIAGKVPATLSKEFLGVKVTALWQYLLG